MSNQQGREDRFQALLEKIDPTIKKARLEEERTTISKLFIGAYSDAESQIRMTRRHEQALDDAPGLDTLTEKELETLNSLLGRVAAARHLAELREYVRQCKEGERQAVLVREHWAEELERVNWALLKLLSLEDIEKLQKAYGLAATEKPNEPA